MTYLLPYYIFVIIDQFGRKLTGEQFDVAGKHSVVLSLLNFVWKTAFNPLKYSDIRGYIYKSGQCHPGLTHIFNFWHSGILALQAERQGARTSEIKNVG